MLQRAKKALMMVFSIVLIISTAMAVPASASNNVVFPNATIVNDWAYVRNPDGSIIPGRRVDIGDRVRVSEINYDRQLAFVEYPTPSGTRTGWINNCSIIKYDYQGQYHNGSTRETVYGSAYGSDVIGSLDPYEHATPLFMSHSGRTYVVYNTAKGTNTKAGYVNYNGGFTKFSLQ